MIPEKEIDTDIGTWLAHAHFRQIKKLNKRIENNNLNTCNM